MPMRVAVGQHPSATDGYLTFASQLGVSGVQFNTPDLPGEHRWEYEDIRRLVDRVAAFGLTVEAIENLPTHFYHQVMLGGDRTEEQIGNVCATIRALGRAGIPILGLCFMPQSVWRTGLGPWARGGATASVYDHAVAADPARRDEIWIARRDRRISDAKDSWVRGSHLVTGSHSSEEVMWDRYERFVRAIVPVAEQANVRIAFHPDDPPVAELDGVARILRSVDALERAISIVDSDALGLDLCLGTVSEMGGRDAVLDAISRFGPSGKICYVHLRDVRGQVPVFQECFLGEGNYSPREVVDRLQPGGIRRVHPGRPHPRPGQRRRVRISRPGARDRLLAGTGRSSARTTLRADSDGTVNLAARRARRECLSAGAAELCSALAIFRQRGVQIVSAADKLVQSMAGVAA